MLSQVTAGGILLAGDSKDAMADALLGEVLAPRSSAGTGSPLPSNCQALRSLRSYR